MVSFLSRQIPIFLTSNFSRKFHAEFVDSYISTIEIWQFENCQYDEIGIVNARYLIFLFLMRNLSATFGWVRDPSKAGKLLMLLLNAMNITFYSKLRLRKKLE